MKEIAVRTVMDLRPKAPPQTKVFLISSNFFEKIWQTCMLAPGLLLDGQNPLLQSIMDLPLEGASIPSTP